MTRREDATVHLLLFSETTPGRKPRDGNDSVERSLASHAHPEQGTCVDHSPLAPHSSPSRPPPPLTVELTGGEPAPSAAVAESSPTAAESSPTAAEVAAPHL